MSMRELSYERTRSHVRVEDDITTSIGGDRGECRVGWIEGPRFNWDAPGKVFDEKDDDPHRAKNGASTHSIRPYAEIERKRQEGELLEPIDAAAKPKARHQAFKKGIREWDVQQTIKDAKLRAQGKNKRYAPADECEIQSRGTALSDHTGGSKEGKPPQIADPFDEILVIALGEGAREQRKHLDARRDRERGEGDGAPLARVPGLDTGPVRTDANEKRRRDGQCADGDKRHE
jgi:hypothetical protein